MPLPPLVIYNTEQEYRDHFERIYCQKTITTFDAIEVRFRKRNFDHCFFESVTNKDDTFSKQRATRIDWIKAVLEDSNAELRQGWDNKRKKTAANRRVAIVLRSYVVIIRINNERTRGEFVTAFVAEGRTITQIRTNPIWT